MNITPASSTFPAVAVIRRKRVRKRGQVAEEAVLGMLGRFGDYESDEAVARFATQIGLAILNDSPIVQEYRSRMRPQSAPKE